MDNPTAGGLTWRKSSASGDQGCVGVAHDGPRVLVRDLKQESGPVLAFTHTEWSAFLAGARNGEFDLPEDDPRPAPAHVPSYFPASHDAPWGAASA